MAWFELHQSLSRHRKTLRAVVLLQVDRHKLIGHLTDLWAWGLDNATIDGHLGDATEVEIAGGADWPLEQAETFTKALVVAGFIDKRDDGYWLHDWYDYAGKLNDMRELRKASNRERQARRRAALHNVTVTPTDAREKRDSHTDVTRDCHVSSVTICDSHHPTVPNPTGPNRTQPEDSSAPSSPSPPRGRAKRLDPPREPVPKPTPGRDLTAALIDAVRKLDPELAIHGDRARVGVLLKRNPDTDLDLVAEAYVAFHHGEWPGSNWLRGNGALFCAIEDVGGYAAWKREQQPWPAGPPEPISEGDDADLEREAEQRRVEREAAEAQREQERIAASTCRLCSRVDQKPLTAPGLCDLCRIRAAQHAKRTGRPSWDLAAEQLLELATEALAAEQRLTTEGASAFAEVSPGVLMPRRERE